MKIIKRNGTEENFDASKITNAIRGANKDVATVDRLPENIIDSIAKTIEERAEKSIHALKVEEIQDMVEDEINALRMFPLGRAYSQYRFKRALIRQKNTTDDQILSLIAQTNEEIKQENSNKNPTLNSVQRDYIAGEVSKDLSRRVVLSKDILDAHDNGWIHFHDMDYFIQPMFNCCLVNLEDMLQNGTVISETMIEKPHSFTTACNVATQIIAQIASSQYGGQSISLAHLAPFVEISRQKIRQELINESILCNRAFTRAELDLITETRVKQEIRKGIQMIQYQVVTLMTTNGQTPFITVFMYLNEAKNEQEKHDLALSIEEMLHQRIQGIKNEKGVWITPAFPKLIYVLQEDNIQEDSEYYYLTKLAAKCTAKRMVPDYISEKVMKQIKVDETGEAFCFAVMGCVPGDELVTYKYDDKLYVEGIGRLWDRMSEKHTIEKQKAKGQHFFMETKGLTIWDTAKKEFTPVTVMVKNNKSKVMRVTFSNGRIVTCTLDHPFTTENRGDVHAVDLIPNEDSVLLSNYQYTEESKKYNDIESAWLLGLILCDGCYDRALSISLAETEEDDIIDRAVKAIKNIYGLKCKIRTHHRGAKGNYKEIYVEKSANLCKELKVMFGELQKKTRHIPNEVFSWDRESKIAFIAGMIDADGYLNDNRKSDSIFQIGSTNKELALQQAALLMSVSNYSHVYANHYSSKHPEKIRYRVEVTATSEIVEALACQKKKDHFVEASIKEDETVIGVVTKIEMLDEKEPTYDVTTDSEHFEISMIYSHNCRSALTPYRDENGDPKFYGRFNQGVVTINLPHVALSSNKNIEEFWKIFDERLEICHRALIARHERLEGTLSDVSPIHWQFGGISRLKKGETIDKLLHNGYSTISLGYAGLYECVKYMTGYSHTEEYGKEVAIAIMQHMNDKCNEWKKAENVAYSLYGTPLESTTYKFAKSLQRDFGSNIKDVTDHNYITNSYHVNVREEIDAFTKLKIESDFQELSPGGAISYVEVPNMKDNIPAVLSVMKFIYDNIMYAELNTKSDYCQVCGFDGEIQIVEEDGTLEWECPCCKNRDQDKMNVARRTCGYIGTQFWNQGRTQEIRDRVLHL